MELSNIAWGVAYVAVGAISFLPMDSIEKDICDCLGSPPCPMPEKQEDDSSETGFPSYPSPEIRKQKPIRDGSIEDAAFYNLASGETDLVELFTIEEYVEGLGLMEDISSDCTTR